MYYQTMQSQAREKHHALRQEAEHHRLARQAGTSQNESHRRRSVRDLTTAIAAFASTLLTWINN